MTPSLKRPLSTPLRVSRALREFLQAETSGAVVLLAAAIAAVGWANSPWQDSYHHFWSVHGTSALGRWQLDLSLREWVNEGLMTIFFLVVGLEIKRELVGGELSDRRRASLPIVAALGGMVVPAALYLAFNLGGNGSHGWGIPMATDIAFALGVLALVAPRVPDSVRVFLLALAIVDDIGAIVVIAIFYSGSIDVLWFGLAVGGVACAYVVRRHGRAMAPGLVVLGLGVWLALHGAGVHPTIAGVAFGLLVPASSLRRGISPLEWLEHRIHPWSTWLIMPMFALANAGVTLPADSIRDAAGSPVTIGVVLGLVAGKIIGIVAAARIACRLGWADLPTDATWRHVGGVAALGGIGFTVSLFVTRLAFDDDTLVANATIGIYVAAAATSLVALIIFWRTRTPTARSGPGRAWRRRGARTRPRQTAIPHQAR